MSEFDGDDDWHGKYTTAEYRDYIHRKALIGMAESAIKESSGKKWDNGKLKMGMVLEYFSRAFTQLAEVGTYGNKKYGDSYHDDNFKRVSDAIPRYKDAFMRHFVAYLEGVEYDTESDKKHLAHAAWNIMALLQLEEEDEG